MKKGRCAIAGLCLALGASPAHATPGFWQRAREPGQAEQQLVLNRIERLLGSIGLPEFGPELSAGAIALSQLGQIRWPCITSGTAAAHPTRPTRAGEFQLDPRLEYLIGSALVDSNSQREAEARCVLEQALRDAPNSPLAAHGLADLAIAAAKLGDRAAEHAAYLRALDVTWEPDSRANLLANLAESDMALGDLPRAIREYRSALAGSQQPDLAAGAYFGLAVALDRSGDLPSALDAAKRALSIQLPPSAFPASSVLDLPNVFFTPSYEIHYYKGLRAMAAVQLAKDDIARRDALADAAEEWTAYRLLGEIDHAPWLQRAALHQASVERQLTEVSARLPKKSAPSNDSDAPEVL
ncbi:MAG: tetratricopeptide repeat protein [Polyangiaceae bacterium]